MHAALWATSARERGAMGQEANLLFMGSQNSRQPDLIDQGINATWLYPSRPEWFHAGQGCFLFPGLRHHQESLPCFSHFLMSPTSFATCHEPPSVYLFLVGLGSQPYFPCGPELLYLSDVSFPSLMLSLSHPLFAPYCTSSAVEMAQGLKRLLPKCEDLS